MPEAPKIGPLPFEERASQLVAIRRKQAAIRANCARQSQVACELRELSAEARDRLRQFQNRVVTAR